MKTLKLGNRTLHRYTTESAWRRFIETESYKNLINYCWDNSADEPVLLFPDISPEDCLPTGTLFISKNGYYPFGVGIDFGCGFTYATISSKDINPNRLSRLTDLLKKSASENAITSKTIEDIISKNRQIIYPHTSSLMDHSQKMKPLPKSLANYVYPYAMDNLGSLSPGNHFIELHKISNEDPPIPRNDVDWLVLVHNGSGPLGEIFFEVLRQGLKGQIKGSLPLFKINSENSLNDLFWSIRNAAANYARFHRHKILEWTCEALGVIPTFLGDNSHTDIIMRRNAFMHFSGVSQVDSPHRIMLICGSAGSPAYLTRVTKITITLGGISHGTGTSFFAGEEISEAPSEGISTNIGAEKLKQLSMQHRRLDLAYEILWKERLVDPIATLEPIFVYKS